MNHKERIDAVLNHKEVDRTPFALVDGGAWVVKQEGITYRELYHMPDSGASVIKKYMDEIDTDTISGVNGVFTAPLTAYGCEIDIDHSGSPVNTKACITDLEAVLAKWDKNEAREMLLANDFVRCMLNQCENVKKLVGDDKYIHVDIAGPFTMACVMYGTAEYMVLTMKNKEQAKKLLELTTQICMEMMKLLKERGADIAFFAEPCASGTMISPKMMKDWVLPGLVEVKDAVGFKYNFCHVCGASGMRTVPLAEAGFNAFSCDYGVDLDKALTDSDGRMVLYGNLNPAGTLLFNTAEEVYEEACERIKTANGRGHILAPGCDLGCDTPFENVLAMSRACKDMA